MIPQPEQINEALNTRLREVLDPEDQWMLGIPRVVQAGRHTSDVVVSDSGGAVILLPTAAFGSLFRWNEQHVILQEKKGRGEGPANPRNPSLVKLNCGLFTGEQFRPGEIDDADYYFLWMNIDQWAFSEEGRTNRDRVWNYTVFQQCHMVLHEFGHIKLMNDGQEMNGPGELTRLLGQSTQDSWNRFCNEMVADSYTSEWLRKLADNVCPFPRAARLRAMRALMIYFVLIDMVNERYGDQSRQWEYSVRFLFLLSDLGQSDEVEPFAKMLDFIGRLAGRTTREALLGHEYRARLLEGFGSCDENDPRCFKISNVPQIANCFGPMRAMLGLQL